MLSTQVWRSILNIGSNGSDNPDLHPANDAECRPEDDLGPATI